MRISRTRGCRSIPPERNRTVEAGGSPRSRAWSARITLLVVSSLFLGLIAPFGSQLAISDAKAAAVPTPLLTSLLKPSSSPSGSPSPSPEQAGSEDPPKDESSRRQRDRRRGEGSSYGGEGPNRSGRSSGEKLRTRGREQSGRGEGGKRRAGRVPRRVLDWRPRSSGSYGTTRLVEVATRLLALGYTSAQIARKVYAPFIVAGRATWSDTWGAPRYGPGPRVRTHEGQDVFCDAGAPVLAVERGRVEFDQDDLGGRIARLRRADGGYWYYAHLGDWNLDQFSSGERISRGEVLGFCGNSGNAQGTPPHVHFGLYSATGNSVDPLPSLLGWLRTAESRISDVDRGALQRFSRLSASGVLSLRRRFGDDMAPSPLVEVGCELNLSSVWRPLGLLLVQPLV